MDTDNRDLLDRIKAMKELKKKISYKINLCKQKKKRDYKLLALLQSAFSNADSKWSRYWRLLKVREERERKRQQEEEDAKHKGPKYECLENDPENDKAVSKILDGIGAFLSEVKNYSAS